jgi:hypothetical protein
VHEVFLATSSHAFSICSTPRSTGGVRRRLELTRVFVRSGLR